MKKQWQEEWNRERAMAEQDREENVLQALNAKIDRMREKETEAERVLLEELPSKSAAAKPHDIPRPAEEMQNLLPKPRPPEDDGWEWLDPNSGDEADE